MILCWLIFSLGRNRELFAKNMLASDLRSLALVREYSPASGKSFQQFKSFHFKNFQEKNFTSDKKMKEGFCQGQSFRAPLGGSILCSPVKSSSGK